MPALDLTTIWAGIILFAVAMYVVMDGFDLGIGILFTRFQVGAERDAAMNSIAPVWDGNETWLVLGGGGLMAAFPLAYAIILPALYAPIIAMLLSLIFRGVAFEFRWARSCASRALGRGILSGVDRRHFRARRDLGCIAARNPDQRTGVCGRLLGLADAVQPAYGCEFAGGLCVAWRLLVDMEDGTDPCTPRRAALPKYYVPRCWARSRL